MTLGTPAAAEPLNGDKAVVVSLLKEAIEAWSHNDTEAATRNLSPSIVITDSTAPYLFRGPTAVSDWMKAFAADAKANDITDPWETLGEPTEVEVNGPHAYIAVPTVYGFKQHGQPVRVDSTVTVALEKSGKNWSFVSWTWSKR
jgi:SnoaL-like domain